MAKPHIHAINSAKRFGGVPEDYQAIHDFIDISKSAHGSMKHRVVLHSALGCYITERVFGHTLKNSEGKEFSVRDVAEQHIIDDLGFLPSLEDWTDEIQDQPWMSGMNKLKDKIKVVD